MDNENNTEVKNQTVTDEQPKDIGTDPKEEAKPLDSDKLVKKLQKRIGKEQDDKHSLQDQLDKANAKIKELTKSKGVKELSDEDKAKKAEDDKDREIQKLRAQLVRRDNIKQTDDVFKEAGLSVSDDVLNMVVVDDDKQTYANVQALIKFVNKIQDGVKKSYLKGSTPRQNGKPSLSKEDISKIKDPVKRVQAIRQNMSLYNK